VTGAWVLIQGYADQRRYSRAEREYADAREAVDDERIEGHLGMQFQWPSVKFIPALVPFVPASRG